MHISKPLPRLFVFFLRSANLQVHWPRGLLLMDWCRLEVDGRPYIEDCPRGDVRWLWGRHTHRRRNSAGLAVVKDEETLSVPLIAPRRQLSGDVFDPLRSVRRASYRIQLFFLPPLRTFTGFHCAALPAECVAVFTILSI